MIGELIKIRPEDLPVKPGRRKPLWRRRWFHLLLLLGLVAVLASWVGAQMYLRQFRERAAVYDLTKLRELEESSIVYDRNGLEIGRLATENRQLVSYQDLPAHLIDALVATEDSRFREHRGVDYIGILRAAVQNFLKGRRTQGASTITQQLARQTFQLYDNTYERKLVEVFLAERIENAYTKNEILELYLNRIYFGPGIYGIEAAAHAYFSKPARELTLEESAAIVGLIKNPRRYNPINGNREWTLRERNEVYDRMEAENRLTPEQVAQLKARPLVVNLSETVRASGYVQAEVEREAERILERLGYEGIIGKGYRIHTTVDGPTQLAAEESIRKRLAEIEKLPQYPKPPQRETPEVYRRKVAELKGAAKRPETAYLQAAALAIENRTGRILAMVGGREFRESQFNRVTQSRRPAGTVFTPFVFAAAFEEKFFPGSRLDDQPMDNSRIMVGGSTGNLGEWGRERTDASHYPNPIPARRALAEGINNSTARLGLALGVDRVRDFAARAGLGDLPQDPAILLGRHETSLTDLCLAYTAFANGGTRPKELSLITRIESADGRVIYQRPENFEQVAVTDPMTAWMVHSCLSDVLSEYGTGAPAFEYGWKEDVPAAGKTGTHSNFTDLWFAGYDSEVTCVVWTGMDRREPVYPNAFGNRTSLPIWVDIMNASLKGFPAREIEPPAEIRTVELCGISGQLATDACMERRPDPQNPGREKLFSSAYEEYVRPGFRIEGFCTFHEGHTGISVPQMEYEPPQIGGPPVGIPLDSEEARVVAVKLEAPTVIGEDPYRSHAGNPGTGDDPAASAPAPDFQPRAKGPAHYLPAPVFDPKFDPLTPSPGRADLPD